MPIYYNTAAPSSTSKNSIKITSVDYGIRDFLLNLNLLPVYPSKLNQLPSPKIGEPVLDTVIGTGNILQPIGLPLETEGIKRMTDAVALNKLKSQKVEELVDIKYTLSPDRKVSQEEYRKNATIKNLYLDVDKQVDVADWITYDSNVTQQIKGYLDTYGGLNLGDSGAIQASSIIGSVLNGQGLGLAKGGVVTNFDLRSSLAGRVLGATGVINDTKLGMIGGQQLALALANNAAFNVEQSALGALNLQDNVLSLVKNGTLAGFRPNYQITVASGTGARVLDYTARILGFTLPKSLLGDSGSIFLSESDSPNIERANSMILNTGKGQVLALIKNAFANINGTTVHDSPDITRFRSGYAPGYKDNKGVKAINPNVYAFGDSDGMIYNFITTGLSPIPEISYNRDKMIEKSGFSDFASQFLESYDEGRTPNSRTYSWGSDNGAALNVNSLIPPFVGPKKSLLAKTQELFNSVGMINIVSVKGDMTKVPSQIQTAIVGGGISKGSAVMSSNSFTADGLYNGSKKTADDTYCRSWTTFSRYEKVQNLVRSSGINTTIPYKGKIIGSVLDQYGIPQIAPYSTDKPEDPKKYMFSIENLAWSDNINELPDCEIGPGDLINSRKGRIMWFPPYNIKINENDSANWEGNQFIGRGESVYTYNNTERSGNLSFSVVVDHPSYVNSFRGNSGPDDHYVSSFFAGCVDETSEFAKKLTIFEKDSIIAASVLTKTPPKVITPELTPDNFVIYFPNDVYDFNSVYENGLSGATPIDYNTYTIGAGATYTGELTHPGKTYVERYNYGLNGQQNLIEINGVNFSGFSDPAYLTALKTYLDEKCPTCVVTVQGFASVQGVSTANTTLADKRSASIAKILKDALFPNLTTTELNKKLKQLKGGEITTSSCVANGPVDSFSCKVDRRVSVTFSIDPTLSPDDITKPEPVIPKQEQKITSSISNRFYTECNYFEQLTDTDNFVFDRFRDKIKYFHPAFHSTTPEGLNSRLTFLKQCLRQGPTLESQGANNLAFGRPPVCILRVGDFYNTKIIIDSINVDYEPIVWDLNPEGVGVQPMIANVTMSFKFIGGSSLLGPINKLQNALSFNYYANTQVYDPRADYIAKLSDNYEVANDFKPVNHTITNETIIQNTPIPDQKASQDDITGVDKNNPQPDTVQNDMDKIKATLLVVQKGSKLIVTFRLSDTLSKTYDFRLTITDGPTSRKELGIGTLTTGSILQEFTYDIGRPSFVSSNFKSGLINGKNYHVIANLTSTMRSGQFIFTE